jgi:hypothetical protein
VPLEAHYFALSYLQRKEVFFLTVRDSIFLFTRMHALSSLHDSPFVFGPALHILWAGVQDVQCVQFCRVTKDEVVLINEMKL